jgi:hypothetical protein
MFIKKTWLLKQIQELEFEQREQGRDIDKIRWRLDTVEKEIKAVKKALEKNGINLVWVDASPAHYEVMTDKEYDKYLNNIEVK